MTEAILKYKLDSQISVQTEHPKRATYQSKLMWEDLSIDIGKNKDLLKNKPTHLTLEFYTKDGITYLTYFILDITNYEKIDNIVKITYNDCIIKM